MNQLFLQLRVLVITLQEAEKGPPLLTAEEIDVAESQVWLERRWGQMEYRAVCGSSYIGLTQEYSVKSSMLLWKAEYSLPDGRWPSWYYYKNLASSRGPNLVSATLHVRPYQKIFERAVVEGLRKHFQGKCTLSANWYGFRAGCSTINAAGELKKLAASVI